MSAGAPHNDPPPYDEPEDDDVNKTLQPTILVLSGQSIHAESADAAPLYQLNRGVAKLTYATSEVELKRVDRVVKTDGNDEPAIRPRARHIYDLKHAKGLLGTVSSLPPDTPPIYIEAMSRKELGNFGLKKSYWRPRWKVLPVDLTGKSSKYNFHAYAKDAKPLFEVRLKHGRYEWADSEGNAIAMEDGGEEQHRLLITAALHRETVDMIVALWCCRLWQDSAENEEPLYSGVDGVRRKFALAKETPMGPAKSGAYL